MGQLRSCPGCYNTLSPNPLMEAVLSTTGSIHAVQSLVDSLALTPTSRIFLETELAELNKCLQAGMEQEVVSQRLTTLLLRWLCPVCTPETGSC